MSTSFLDPPNDYAFVLMKKIPRGIIMPRALVGYVSSFFLQGTKLLLTQGDKKKKKLSVYSEY